MKLILKLLFSFAIIATFVAGIVAYQQYKEFKISTLESNVDSFVIAKGSNIRSIAKSLKNKRIINSSHFFRLLAKLEKQENYLKAGEYELKKGMTPSDLLNHFSKGNTIQYKTRLPEGFSFKQLVAIIKEDKNLKHTLTDDDYQNIMKKIETKYSHHKPEGWFYPDTYNYPKGTTDLQFLQRAHNAMIKVLDKLWVTRTKFKGINSPYDALILASIVEKETGHSSDRGKVARVFINRLKIDMLLQTDPTVIYGMGEKYKGNIRKKDLKKDTPYNTYTRKGLTPTPISTPSEASLEAVFSPNNDESILYFVAKGNGKSYFSKTYKEHKKAVIKYLLNGKKNRYKGN